MKFYSHIKRDKYDKIIYEKELKIHLSDVATAIKLHINETPNHFPIDSKHLSEFGNIIGVSHDFGKYTEYFQNKLQGKNNVNYSDHGLISALFGFMLANEYSTKIQCSDNPDYIYLPLIIYQIIKHHHGNLSDISKDADISSNIEMLKEQINNIKKNKSYIELELSDLLCKHNFKLDTFFQMFDEFDDTDYKTKIQFELARLEYLYNFSETDEDIKLYYFILNQYLYSLLIANDKISAAATEKQIRKSLAKVNIDAYKEEKFNLTKDIINEIKLKSINKLNFKELREKVYQEVREKLKSIDIADKHIFTLTAPTGIGKTLTAFASALDLRDKIIFQSSEIPAPKIIYSLPFTSIIEQNFSVMEDILKIQIVDYAENKNQYLLKHHYFQNAEYKTGNEMKSVNEALLYIENWDSEIIITTFLQFFYTLIGYQNKPLKKFHTLTNAIIILDEIQNIPVKYWQLVNTILRLLVKYFNTYIILLTATKPLIFNEYEAVELLENSNEYFNHQNLQRTKIENKISDITDFDSLVNYFNELLKAKAGLQITSVMFILNTIKSTLDFFKIISNKAEFQDWKKIYLSTNITPYERINRIKTIKDFILKKEKVIIVTTQLIEAGVDIDVNLIFRDYAPFDSIIQTAGRANRNNTQKKEAQIYITCLKDINNKNMAYSKYIYDKISLDVVASIFNKRLKPIFEKEYLKIINDYFKEISEKKSKLKSTDLLKSMKEFYYFDNAIDSSKRIPVSEFKLIEELPNYVSLFVEINEEAKKVWKLFSEIKNEIDLFLRKNKFEAIKGDFNLFILSIPIKVITNCETIIEDELYYLSYENIFDKKNEIYNKPEEVNGTGYNRELTLWML